MKKEEFIETLKKKLSILEEDEINDIIEEYSGYIDEKIKSGKTEEEAIKDFGDINELATELLKAYKINVENKDKNNLNIVVEKVNSWMDAVIKFFSKKSGSEILRVIIEIFLIILGICICKIPFVMIKEIGRDIFLTFQNSFGRGLCNIWEFMIELVYLIFAVILFLKIVQKRYLDLNLENEDVKEEKENKKESKTEKKAEKEKTIKEKPQRKGLLDYLASLCIWFLKFIGVWILFGIACYILGLGITVGISLYLIIQGVYYFGIYLTLLILMILGILSFILLFNWIINRKNNGKLLLIGFIIAFVGLGISISYASIEIATTEYLGEYDKYEEKKKEETISYEDDLILFGSNEYEIDETLENKIKITYTYYSEFYEVVPIIKETDNRIYLNYDYKDQKWSSEIIKEIISDLKDHKIHNYDFSTNIKITTSSKNIEQLKENKRAWTKRKNDDYEYENCERMKSIYGINGLSSYCKNILDLEIEEDL